MREARRQCRYVVALFFIDRSPGRTRPCRARPHPARRRPRARAARAGPTSESSGCPRVVHLNEIAAQGPDQPGAQGPDLGTPPVPTGTPLDPGRAARAPQAGFRAATGRPRPDAIAGQGPDQPERSRTLACPPSAGRRLWTRVSRVSRTSASSRCHRAVWIPNAIAGQGPDLGAAQGPGARLAARPHGGRPAARRAGTPGRARPPRNRIPPLPTGGLDPNAGVGDAPVQRHALPEELARVAQKQEIDPGVAGDAGDSGSDLGGRPVWPMIMVGNSNAPGRTGRD